MMPYNMMHFAMVNHNIANQDIAKAQNHFIKEW